MSLPRRDFMKSLGISIGSILLAGSTKADDLGEPRAGSVIPEPALASNKENSFVAAPRETHTPTPELFPQKPSNMTEEAPVEETGINRVYPFNNPDYPPRARLRHCWFYLSWLARRHEESQVKGEWACALLIRSHRAALVELIVAGKMSEAIARDVQKGFDAAVSHVHTSNAPIVCYD